MIRRETGQGLSISGAHRVAAVEGLVGATLVVALPRTAPPSAGHCLGTTGPGGWSGDFLVADWDRRPERRLERRRPRRRLGPASFRAPGVATWSGDSTGGTMRPRRAPTRGAPTVIGDWKFQRSPPPPGLRHDPTRNWAGIVHQRRPPRCRCPTTRSLLGRGVARRLSRGTMRPRRAPTRGAPTVIGDRKFQRRGRWMTSEIGFNFANGRRD